MTSYAHFSNPYDSLTQLPLSTSTVSGGEAAISNQQSPATVPGTGTGTDAGRGTGTGCCETGRPVATDPVTGHVICSCQYESGRLSLNGSAGRLAGAPAAHPLSYGANGGSALTYGTAAYPSTEHNPYPSIGVDSAAYFSQLANPYGLKDSAMGTDMGVYGTITATPAYGYNPYEAPMYAAYTNPYELAARRKNATRESTNTLKAWLNEHKKNPYPTKGEKIMLAIITKMTLTQVSTWFANARRRLKKENKMTWEPRNRTDDDDDDDGDISDKEDKVSEKSAKLDETTYATAPAQLTAPSPSKNSARLADDDTEGKPRIWSLAETASTHDPARLTSLPTASWPTPSNPGHSLLTTGSLQYPILPHHPSTLCPSPNSGLTSSSTSFTDKHRPLADGTHPSALGGKFCPEQTHSLDHQFAINQPLQQQLQLPAPLTANGNSCTPPRTPPAMIPHDLQQLRASAKLAGGSVLNHSPALPSPASAGSATPHLPSTPLLTSSFHPLDTPLPPVVSAGGLDTAGERTCGRLQMTPTSHLQPLQPALSAASSSGEPSMGMWSGYHQWKHHYTNSAAAYGAAAAAVAAAAVSAPFTAPHFVSSHTVSAMSGIATTEHAIKRPSL